MILKCKLPKTGAYKTMGGLIYWVAEQRETSDSVYIFVLVMVLFSLPFIPYKITFSLLHFKIADISVKLPSSKEFRTG